MFLEAVWFKDGKEVFLVDPVMNIVCEDDRKDISEIEISNGKDWYSCEDIESGADDFVIRIKKD